MSRRLLLQQRFDFFATFLRCDTQTAYCMDFSKVKQETEKEASDKHEGYLKLSLI